MFNKSSNLLDPNRGWKGYLGFVKESNIRRAQRGGKRALGCDGEDIEPPAAAAAAEGEAAEAKAEGEC